MPCYIIYFLRKLKLSKKSEIDASNFILQLFFRMSRKIGKNSEVGKKYLYIFFEYVQITRINFFNLNTYNEYGHISCTVYFTLEFKLINLPYSDQNLFGN